MACDRSATMLTEASVGGKRHVKLIQARLLLVIPALIAGNQPYAGLGACGALDPADTLRDDKWDGETRKTRDAGSGQGPLDVAGARADMWKNIGSACIGQ